MFSEYVPNLELFVRMHVTKEATQSSRIEDTCTEMEEAVLPEEEILEERRDDWREVNNYIRAMGEAIDALNELPFSNRLLREAHATLKTGVRGEYYERLTRVREQNSIGDWLVFFLDGLSETARQGVETFNEILQFEKHWESEIGNWKPHANSGLMLFRNLFKFPVVDARKAADIAGVSPPNAYKLIDRFVTEGLLREITGARRGRLFLFDPYLKLFHRK